MPAIPYHTALIVGAGPGISASFARLLVAEGLKVGLAARDTTKLAATGLPCFAADVSQPDSVAQLFAAVDAALGPPDVVLFNPSARVPGPLAELDPAAVQQSLAVSA